MKRSKVLNTSMPPFVLEDHTNAIFSRDLSDESLLLLKKSYWKSDTPESIKERLVVPAGQYSERYTIKDTDEYKNLSIYCVKLGLSESYIKDNIIFDEANKKLFILKEAVSEDHKKPTINAQGEIIGIFSQN